MRIGLISQTYAPERGAAAQATVIANSLARRGHQVRVVTGFPNYPDGKLYPGWTMSTHRHDRVDGLPVHRTALYTDHSRSAAKRMLHYLSWSATAVPAAWHDLGGADVNLVFSSPATTAIPGLAAKLAGAPMVLYIQDLWPDSVTASGFLSTGMRALESALNVYCDLTYRNAAHIVVLAPRMRETLISRGVAADKVSTVMNWADESCYGPRQPDPQRRAELGLTRPFVVMYAGNFGAYQRLDVLLEAARLLRGRGDVEFALIGAGVEEAALRRQAAGLDNVSFHPPVDKSAIADVLALGDLHYVSLPPLPHLQGTIPSKTQATLACGRAVLAAAPGDTNDLVRQAAGGFVVDEADPQAVARAVEEAADDPAETARRGAAGRTFYAHHLSAAHAAAALESVLEAARRRR